MASEESTSKLYEKIDELKDEIHGVNVTVTRLEGKIDNQSQQDDQHHIDIMQLRSDLKDTNERVDNVESHNDNQKGALRMLYILGGVFTGLFILAQVLVMIFK